jgi:hypothetical protein
MKDYFQVSSDGSTLYEFNTVFNNQTMQNEIFAFNYTLGSSGFFQGIAVNGSSGGDYRVIASDNTTYLITY